MKKGLLLAFLNLSFIVGFAQDSGVGIIGGANFTNLSKSTADQTKISFHAGTYIKWGISEFFSLQPEILYSVKGAQTKRNPTPIYENNGKLYEQQRIVLSYIDVPVLARFNASPGFHFLLGPQISFLVRATNKFSNDGHFKDSYEIIENKNRIDIGLVGGLGYEFENGLNFGLRGSFGFVPVFKDSEIKNSVVQITTGYTFGGRED